MGILRVSMLCLFLLSHGSTEVSRSSQLTDEVCDNAIDDDNDGLIDLNDPDCVCEIVSQESLIPNPSFEDYSCCPSGHTQLSCARRWSQASGGTADYLNHCGYLPVTTLSPFPDGEGAVLFLTGAVPSSDGTLETHDEYAGACLNQPMKKDSVYELKFHLGFADSINSPPVNISFFGSPSCSNLPFTSGFDCPTNYPDWYLLSSQIVTPNETPLWREVNMVIQPEVDIKAIVLGGDCANDLTNRLSIYLLDNLILNNQSHFDFELSEIGHPCDPAFSIAVKDHPDFLYQWYKEGVALVGETSHELRELYGEGPYQLRIINQNTGQCRTSEDYIFSLPIIESEITASICEGSSYLFDGEPIEQEGQYFATFPSENGCDSIVTLQLEVTYLADTNYAKILPGGTYRVDGNEFRTAGEHHYTMSTLEGCHKSIVLYLEQTDIYIPNAFSPNGDNINDYFEVYSNSDEVMKTELSIFDRWGNLVFVGEKWDGTSGNSFAYSGLYTVLIRITGHDGTIVTLSNGLHLVR